MKCFYIPAASTQSFPYDVYRDQRQQRNRTLTVITGRLKPNEAKFFILYGNIKDTNSAARSAKIRVHTDFTVQLISQETNSYQHTLGKEKTCSTI